MPFPPRSVLALGTACGAALLLDVCGGEWRSARVARCGVAWLGVAATQNPDHLHVGLGIVRTTSGPFSNSSIRYCSVVY